MENIANSEFVFYDDKSLYPYEDLNETLFMESFFKHLISIMGESLSDYVFFVYSSYYNLNDLPNSAHIETEKKKVLVFISDESGVPPIPFSNYYHAIFKMYLQTDKFEVENIFPFQLGCVKEVPAFPYIPVNDRRYSSFFSGNLNIPRVPFFSQLSFVFKLVPKNITRSLLKKYPLFRDVVLKFNSSFDNFIPNSYIRFTSGFKKGLKPDVYGEMLANSKIIFCPAGFTQTECFRHYEAMRAGCVIISERLSDVYFYKDSPMIQINNWTEGFRIAREILKNPQELEKRSKDTLEWYHSRCSEEATAHYVYSCLNSINKNND